MKLLALLGVAVGLTLAASVAAPSPAAAARGERIFVRVDLPQTIPNPEPGVAFAPPSRLLFVNWCDGNCVIQSGGEDSRTNMSSIISGTRTLTQFAGTAEVRAQILACVRTAYARFNIQVTDRDPGNVPHWETMAAGLPREVGFPSGVAGVSPFSCGLIPNAITYNFLNLSPNDVLDNCWTIAQESAHAFGLSHEFDGRDYMTYNPTPQAKSFVDENLCIGTQGCCQPAQECQCGGTMQNSFQQILALFGPASASPPTIRIDKPRNNQGVDGAFEIGVTASDATGIDKVDILIDGMPYTSLMSSPYTATGPATLAAGRHVLTAVEIDSTSAVAAAASVDFAVGLADLGEDCSDSASCASGQCAVKGGDQFCSEPCDLAADTCPDGFSCLSNGAGGGLCWPLGPGCLGCSTDSNDPTLPIGFGLFVAAVVVRRRRRA
jgi:MYXO-CTERM domain-containing protein